MDNQIDKEISQMIDEAIDQVKKTSKIGTYSRVTYDEVGQPLVEGIRVAINNYKNGAIKEFNNLVKALEYKRDFMSMEESEYYKELEVLRNNYLIKGSSDWWKYTAQIIEYEQSITLSEQEEAKLRQDVMDDALKAKQKYLDSVLKAQKKYADKLKAYGDNFFAYQYVSTSEKTDGVEGSAVLTNYEAYINRLNKFQQGIDKLKGRNIIPDDLFNEITKMDIDEGMEYVTLLNKTPDDKLKKYINDRAEYIRLSEEMATKNIGPDNVPQALDSYTKSMESIFGKAGLVLPDNFYKLGETGADDFGEGFMGGLKIIEEGLTENFTQGFVTALERAAQIISDAYSQFNFSSGEKLGQKVTNINNTFTVGSEKQSSTEQITAWRNAQELQRLRGI
ncbi:MAG: hypothetical protein PHE51_10365 [Eubacteriales bacterium]|nr:hypothetical protein [Eubacteriales bacterium]